MRVTVFGLEVIVRRRRRTWSAFLAADPHWSLFTAQLMQQNLLHSGEAHWRRVGPTFDIDGQSRA